MVEPGKPWRATLELFEFGRAQRPTLVARQGARNVIALQRRVWIDPQGAARYRTRLTFPAAGRWRIEVMSGKRRFEFPGVAVGSGEAPVDYVAFPEGSRAKREGGGGIVTTGLEPSGGYRDASLPPEVVSLATREEDEDGGLPAWIFPLAGIVLAGAAVVSRRRR